MPNNTRVATILELLESAQTSIRSAKAMLSEITGVTAPTTYAPRAAAPMSESVQGRVVEGEFDGQNMVGDDHRTYPVPPNYASKSKLVQGDRVKLTITETGAFIYKQIGPIPRRNVVGTVAFEDGQYKILCDGRSYRVLMASITFYKAEMGQRLSILLPEGREAEWATVDNIMPEGSELAAAPEAAEQPPAEEAPAAAPKRKRKTAE